MSTINRCKHKGTIFNKGFMQEIIIVFGRDSGTIRQLHKITQKNLPNMTTLRPMKYTNIGIEVLGSNNLFLFFSPDQHLIKVMSLYIRMKRKLIQEIPGMLPRLFQTNFPSFYCHVNGVFKLFNILQHFSRHSIRVNVLSEIIVPKYLQLTFSL